MVRSAAKGRWATAGLLFVLSCQETDLGEPHFGRPVSQGEHVEIWASPGVEVCGGNLEYLEAFVDALRAEVGADPGPQDRHRYYVLNDEDWKQYGDVCGAECTSANRSVYTLDALPSRHEMVHAELSTKGHRFFEEGLAVVYGEPIFNQSPTRSELLDGLREPWAASRAHGRAGHFASFVIARRGIEAFMRVKDASRPGDSLAELSDIFVDELGEPLEPLLLDYEEYEDECSPPGYQALLVECDQTPTPWSVTEDGALQIEFDVDFGCSDSDVLGPYDGRIYVTRALELQQRTEVLLAVSGGQGVEVRVSRCDGSCAPWDPATKARADTFWRVPNNYADAEHLDAGRYTVQISKPLELGPSNVRVLLTEWD